MNRRESMKRLESLTLADDFMFQQVMSKPDIAKDFLEAVLHKTITSITLHTVQSTHDDDYCSRGVRFDVEFIGDDVVYDIEMQKSNKAARQQNLLKRVRYYQSSIDRAFLAKGNDFDKLPESCIIFVCDFDPFNTGLAQYTQIPMLQELHVPVDNGTTVIYLSTLYSVPNVSEEVLSFLDYLKNEESVTETESELIHKMHFAVEEAKYDENVRRAFMTLREMIAEEREDAEEQVINVLARKLGKTTEELWSLLAESGTTIHDMNLHRE